MKGFVKTLFLAGTLATAVTTSALAQKQKKSISLKDSLDGNFDLSDYIIDANGFYPYPISLRNQPLADSEAH